MRYIARVDTPGLREPVTAAALVSLFEAEDLNSLLQALPGMADDARDKTWGELRKPLSTLLEGEPPHTAAGADFQTRIRFRALFSLAVGPIDVVRLVGGYVLLTPRPPDLDRVLASRTLMWRDAFTTATLRAWASETEVGLLGPYWWEQWQRLRQLERSAVLRPDPTSADYLVLMVRGMMFSDSIVRAIRRDRDVIEPSVWALFEPGPGVQRALLALHS
jgi:hypothetical protein